MNVQAKLTPMLQQYLEIKEQHPGTILFYRMGDFYEMFFEDAELASRVLGITLTSRNKKTDEVQVPMCGIPYHALQGYLGKMIKAGHRVAICEQVEDPSEAKGIVKREVTKIVSPGVITDDLLLDDKANNYLACLWVVEKSESILWAVSCLDVSTGSFFVGEFTDEQGRDEALDQLARLSISELLFDPDTHSAAGHFADQLKAILPALCVSPGMLETETVAEARDKLLEHFQVLSLDGFGCSSYSAGLIASAKLLEHVRHTQKSSINHIERLTPLDLGKVLQVDESSRRNLELTQTLIGAQKHGSLLAVLDHTCTPMGARLLRQYLLAPLREPAKINRRLDSVSYLYKNSGHRRQLRELLNSVHDLERLNSRVIIGSANGRDLVAMRNSLANLPHLLALLETVDTSLLLDIREQLDPLSDLNDLLLQAIHDEPPVGLREGNLIQCGYNPELDELNTLLRDGKQLIARLEESERQASGIAKLKIGYNKVFGYFFEVSKAQSENVPDYFIRKQTLVNAERFITPELKDFEAKVMGAEERKTELEYQLFQEVRSVMAAASSRVLRTAHFIAQLDVLTSNAEIAHQYNYRRPEINHDDVIEIIEGRHPVIERNLPTGKFVPNDVLLNQQKDEVLIITGPNMAGKSTVLRQTALIVLMAQMGSFVPAQRAVIGTVDRIFTRVGAMDDLRRGQSTFMVEMSETANILNNATEKSLVILDEIGRGTSTYDGLSIAWAVAEELVNKNQLGVKTMFATHYHELTELAKTHSRVQNYSIAVREWQGNILFLHKLVRGGTSRSYGIQVAALAGVPQQVVKRAEEILKDIETGNVPGQGRGGRRPSKVKQHPDQLSLFAAPADPLRAELKRLDINKCTPLDALNILQNLKNMEKN